MARILIVDDNAANRELISTLVGYDGHEALEAGDGAEALALARAQRPELIVCDILMPTMDGYQFVQQLRADPDIAHTRVIFYTANYHEREARELAHRLGVTRILTKPCLPTDVIAAIDAELAQAGPALSGSPNGGFDAAHLRVLTDKLAAKAAELESANQRLAALTELNLQLAAEHDAASAMDRTCRGVRELLGAGYAIVCIEPNGGRTRSHWQAGFAPAVLDRLRSGALTGHAFTRVMTQRRSIRSRNPDGVHEGIELPADFPPVQSCMVTPIASALSVFGWVCLLNKIGAQEFTRDDEWVANALASQAAHIYENRDLNHRLEVRAADLGMEVRQRIEVERQLRRVLRARRVMAECNRNLVRASDEGGLLREMCRLIVEHGHYLQAWTALAQPGRGGHLEVVACAGEGAPIGRVCRPAADAPIDTLAVKALTTRKPRLLHVPPPSDAHGPGARGRHTAAIPLLSGNQRIGVLCLTSDEVASFDGEEIELLLELADDIAYGVQSLRTRELHRQAEESLRLRERAIESSINAIVISRADLAADNPVIYANAGFEKMSGYPVAEILGRNLRVLLGTDLEQPGIGRLRDAIRHGHDARVTLRNYRKDGSMFWSDIALSSVRDAADRVTHYISVFNDCTESKAYEAELERQANHDALTGLANRNLLGDRIGQALLRAERADTQLAVMMLDLDRFKRINDGLGHADGDRLLQEMAARLTRTVRAEDTVARLGGDEFVVVAPSIASETDAAGLARKILDAVSRITPLSGHEMQVTASLGITLYPRDGASVAELLKNADLAMYRAKELQRGSFQFYSPELNRRVLERLELENGLRRALDQEELELHFQPKTDLHNGRITGAEALIRWRHPLRGLIMPDAFIPLAEESGLIVPIGEWVIRNACRQLGIWRAQGHAGLGIAINVSARQFADETLPRTLAASLAHHGIEAQALTVEVTESAMMADPERAIRILDALAQLGVGVSLDDFGTGYSNLGYLKRFPISSIKIDRSFIEDITNPDGTAIPLMVIALGRSLGLKVVAEGVETAEQADLLRLHGCDEMQGFLFSPPVPADDFADLLPPADPTA